MMKNNETEFAKLVRKLKLDDRPTERHRESVRRQMLNEFNRATAKKGFATDGLHRIWRTIMESRMTKIAVAAIVIVAILVGIGKLAGNDETKPIIVKDTPTLEEKIEINEPTIDVKQAEKLAIEMELAGQLYAAGNAESLIAMLETGEMESKVLAANYLAELGADEAFGAIETLANDWAGDGKNPFDAAVESLRKTIEDKQAEETAVQQEPDQTTELQEGGNSQIAEKPRVYEDITNVYFEETVIKSDGTENTDKAWFRLPNHIREESDYQIVIDNGKKRLTFNRKTMQAQFSESHIPEHPLKDRHMFSQITKMFREKDDKLELVKIGEENNGQTLIYSLKSDKPPLEGTVWVDKASMLPLELEVYMVGEPERPGGMDPNTSQQVGTEILLNYDAIDDSVFDMTIPVGYTELDAKKPGTFTGYVIDEMGNPMAGATVHVKAGGLQVKKTVEGRKVTDDKVTGVADDDGYFKISLPVLTPALWSPVVAIATLPDEPDFIAWTMFRSKKDEKERPCDHEMPGSVGEVKVWEKYGEDVAEKKSWTNWCAGASDITLVMESAGKIVGRVVNGYGEPIANAAIDVTPEPGDKYGNDLHVHRSMLNGTAKSDKDGYYEVCGLPRMWEKSDFWIRVSGQGYVGTTGRVELKAPLEVREANFTMHESLVTVRGTLVDNYGTFLPDQAIFARVDGRDYFACSTKTDKNGKFELKGCPYSEGLQVKAELSHNSYSMLDEENYNNYVFYPDVIADVGCTEGKLEYEVNMTAVLPELVINVEVVDSAGEPIPYFPVEVRTHLPVISSTWESQRDVKKRTDERGRLTLTGVPDVEGLKLVFWGGAGTWGDLRLKDEEKEFIEQIKKDYNKYKWTEIPIEVVEGVKEYSVRAIILTNEEYQREKEIEPPPQPNPPNKSVG